MLQTLKNAWKVEGIRKSLLFTLFILVVYRIGAAIPVPFVNASALQAFFNPAAGDGAEQSVNMLFQYFNLMSGDAFSRATLFALSISPYINASIIMQLLSIAIPALERLSQQGEEGRKKIASITRYVTVLLALVTAFGYWTFLNNTQTGWTAAGTPDYGFLGEYRDNWFAAIVIIVSYCAGASIIMWLGEQINEHGMGNGISVILFANIVASLPGQFAGLMAQSWVVTLIAAIITVATMWFIVYITNAERRIPVQYAKRQVGRKMYGGQNSFLPLKVNMTGVMPIIFASAIVSIPQTIAMFVPKFAEMSFYKNWLSQRGPIYMAIFFLLIIAFAYFYVAISFNPIEVSNNLKKNGGTIPGIRPGKDTAGYIQRSLNKVTLIGAFSIGVIAIIPFILGAVNPAFQSFTFGGSSVIIIVGVVLELWREMEAKMSMRHYKGFLD